MWWAGNCHVSWVHDVQPGLTATKNLLMIYKTEVNQYLKIPVFAFQF